MDNKMMRTWLLRVMVAAITAVFFVLPYVLGHLTAGEGTVYTGLLINLEDGTYLSAIEQGRQGAWVYQNLFTLEPHRPVFIQGFYLALGHVARLLGVTAVTMWHLGLWAVNVILFLLLFQFVTIFLRGRQRIVAMALIIFGAGYDLWRLPAGWERANTVEAIPMEPYVPELHLFYSALTYPHFVMGIVCILLVVWSVWRLLTVVPGERRRWLWLATATVATLVLGVVYPFLVLLPALITGMLWLLFSRWDRRLRWEVVGYLAVPFLALLPLFAYYTWAILTVDVFAVWNAQAVTLTPHPLHVILAYLPYLLLGGLGLRRWREWPVEKQTAVSLLLVWVTAVAILLYIPINPQRRYVEGVQIPLAILAAIGWFDVVWPWLAQTRLIQAVIRRPRYSLNGMQTLLSLGLVGIISLFSLYLYAGAILSLTVLQPYPLFRPAAELDAMRWMRQVDGDSRVVLSSKSSGSYLPYVSGRAMFIGQRYETIAYDERLALSAEFFSAATPESWQLAFLQEWPIDYVFYGRAEREGGEVAWGERPYLQLLFSNDEVDIYQVDRSQLPPTP